MLVCHFNISFLLALCSVGVVHSFAVRAHETNKKGHKTYEDRRLMKKNALVKLVATQNLKTNNPPCSSNAYQVFDDHVGKNFSCKPCDEVVLKCPDDHEIFPECGHVVTKEELAHAKCRPVKGPIKEDTATEKPELSLSYNSGFSKYDNETLPKGVTEEGNALIYEEKGTKDAGVRGKEEDERRKGKLQTVSLEEPERPNKSRSVVTDVKAELTDVDDKVVGDKTGELGRLQEGEDYDDGNEKDTQVRNDSLILIEGDVVMDTMVELHGQQRSTVEKMQGGETQEGTGLASKEMQLAVPEKNRQGNVGLKVQNQDQGVVQDRGQNINFPENENKKKEPQEVQGGNNENAGKENRDLEVTSKQEADEGRIGSENSELAENTERQTESRKVSEEKNGTDSDIHVKIWVIEQEESADSKEKKNVRNTKEDVDEEKMEINMKGSQDDKKPVLSDVNGTAKSARVSARRRTSKRGRKEEKQTVQKQADTRSDANDKDQLNQEAVDEQTEEDSKKRKEQGDNERDENPANLSPRVMDGSDLAILQFLILVVGIIVIVLAYAMCSRRRLQRSLKCLTRALIGCLWRCSDFQDSDDSSDESVLPYKDIGCEPPVHSLNHVRVNVCDDTPKVSRPLSDLLKSSCDTYGDVCDRLDSKHRGYFQILRQFGVKPQTIRARFEKDDHGPTAALLEWLSAKKPDMTVQEFNLVLRKKNIHRKDVVLTLKAFDLCQ